MSALLKIDPGTVHEPIERMCRVTVSRDAVTRKYRWVRLGDIPDLWPANRLRNELTTLIGQWLHDESRRGRELLTAMPDILIYGPNATRKKGSLAADLHSVRAYGVGEDDEYDMDSYDMVLKAVFLSDKHLEWKTRETA